MEAATQTGRSPGALNAPRVPARAVADDELVRRVRAGSIEAFEAVFDRYRDPILSFCRHMLGSREDAEDATQHTFMSAHRGLRDTDRPIDLRPWLFAIARNRCVDMLRARRQSQPLEDDSMAPASVDGLLDTVQGREDLRALVSDIQALPVAQRAALVMFELGGMSQNQLAEVLECRPAHVKALIYQARASLMADREARAVECRGIREELSAARGHDLLRSRLRRHLRVCPGCQEFAGRVRHQREALALVLPALPTAGLKATVLAGVIGGAGAGAGAGVVGVGAIGGGAGAAGASSAIGGGSAGANAVAGTGSAVASTAVGASTGGAISGSAAVSAPTVVGAAAAAAPASIMGGASAGVATTSLGGGGLTTGIGGLLGKGAIVKALAVAGLFGALGGGVSLLHKPPHRAGPGATQPMAGRHSITGPGTRSTSSPPASSFARPAVGDPAHAGGAGPSNSGGGARPQTSDGASGHARGGGPQHTSDSGSQSAGTYPHTASPAPAPHRERGSHGSAGGSGSPIVTLPALPRPGSGSSPGGTPGSAHPLPIPSLPSIPARPSVPVPSSPPVVGGPPKLPTVPKLPLPSTPVGGSTSHAGLPTLSVSGLAVP